MISHRWESNPVVTSFPLSIDQACQKYTRLPLITTGTFYHYTSRAGLKGILESGGLRANFRLTMNDSGEFSYARQVVYEALEELGASHELPAVVLGVTRYIRLNLDRMLDESARYARAYCACMSLIRDDLHQWREYSDEGKGFAIGFNMASFLPLHQKYAEEGKGHLVFLPVLYALDQQKSLVSDLIVSGVADLQRFLKVCSKEAEDLTDLRDRITFEIVVRIVCFIDFFKSDKYCRENEIRFIWENNGGDLLAKDVKHFLRDGQSVPYLFFDMRAPVTGRLLLNEIMIGPNASYPDELAHVEQLLDEVGYGRDTFYDRPKIIQSSCPGG